MRCVRNIREKFEDDPKNPKHIITVHRIGYKFIAQKIVGDLKLDVR